MALGFTTAEKAAEELWPLEGARDLGRGGAFQGLGETGGSLLYK